MKYTTLIFDLDGTLADTLDDLVVAMNKMLVSFGWPKRTRGDLLRFINKGARRFVSLSMPEGSFEDDDGELVTEALKRYRDTYAEAYCVYTKPYGGMTDALRALKNAGYKLAILSNKQDEFVKVIADTLFPDVFDIKNGATPTKPDPSAALAIADELGARPEECVFIGDSDIDMMTGVNAGMYSLGVTWGYRGADVLTAAGAGSLVGEPSELLTAISAL